MLWDKSQLCYKRESLFGAGEERSSFAPAGLLKRWFSGLGARSCSLVRGDCTRGEGRCDDAHVLPFLVRHRSDDRVSSSVLPPPSYCDASSDTSSAASHVHAVLAPIQDTSLSCSLVPDAEDGGVTQDELCVADLNITHHQEDGGSISSVESQEDDDSLLYSSDIVKHCINDSKGEVPGSSLETDEGNALEAEARSKLSFELFENCKLSRC